MSLAYGILNYPTPYMRAFQMWTGLFPVFIQATWIALCSKKMKPAYRVNTKPTGNIKVKKPWLAISPHLGIMILGLFAIIYVFIAGSIAWDFYLLNVVWICWAIWAMSGICFAATKKHKWPQEDVYEQQKPASFFATTKELITTVVLTLCITLFFTMTDSATINRYMNRLRSNVLWSMGIESPGSRVSKEKINHPEVSPVYQIKTAAPMQTPVAEITPPKAVKHAATSGNMVVQVCAARNKKQATPVKKKLIAAGYPAYTMNASVKGKPWIRVRVGFFNSTAKARRVGKDISRKRLIPEGAYWIAKASPKEKGIALGKGG